LKKSADFQQKGGPFNRLGAARDLVLHKSTLFRKIAQLGISLPSRNGRTRKKDK